MAFTILIAVLPTVILSYFVYKKDIIEKEPIDLLIKLFVIGVLSTIPAAFLEGLLLKILPTSSNTMLNAFIISFICISLVEEGYKGLFAYAVAFKNKNFNHIYDGIVYTVFISLGFATLENILYVVEYGTSTAILRALTSVPAHAFFGVSMGYYMGIAKYNDKIGNKKKSKKNKVISILLPILFHGLFDFLLLTENEFMLIVFFLFVIILYALAYIQIKKHSRIMTMME